jgi:hypothetical protein
VSDDQSTETTPATPELLSLAGEYARAKEARARWEAEEKRLKDELLAALEYDPDDPKPTPVDVVDIVSGEVAFGVKVGRYRGLDFNHLRNTYPHIYAECETSKATRSIKLP